MDDDRDDLKVYNYGDHRSQKVSKKAKRKGKSNKLDMGEPNYAESPSYSRDEDSHFSDKIGYENKSKTRKIKKQYLNEGFEEHEGDPIPYNETNPQHKKKRSKVKLQDSDLSLRGKHDAIPDQYGQSDMIDEHLPESETGGKVVKRKKKKQQKPLLSDSLDFVERTDETLKPRSSKSQKTFTDTLDSQHNSLNGNFHELNETQLQEKKTRRKNRKYDKRSHVDDVSHQNIKDDTGEGNLSENCFIEPLEDTGYESFNKKEQRKEKRSKQRKKKKLYETEENQQGQEVGLHVEIQNELLPEDCLEPQQEQVPKQKKKKYRSKRDEQNDIVSETNSPSVQPKIIRVHGRKTKKKDSGIEKDEKVNEDCIDDLLEEFDVVPKQVTIKYDTKLSPMENKRSEEENFDEVDLELEEMLLPKESDRKQKYDDQIDDVLLTPQKKIGKRHKKGAADKERVEEIDTTEVLPFKDDTDSENDISVSKSAKEENGTPQVLSKSSIAENNCVHENGAKLPPRMYAFGQESESEEVSVSESDEEIEIPIERSNKLAASAKYIQPSEKPPKPSKRRTGNVPHPPVLADSSNFDMDVNNDQTDKGKPPRSMRKSVVEIPRSRSPSGSQVSSGLCTELKGIFSIDGHSYDVQFKDDCLTWTSVTGSNKVPKSRKKSFVRGLSASGGSLRGSVASLGSAEIEEMNSLYFQDILGVTVKKEKKSSSKHSDGVCVGFLAYTFDKKDENRLKDRAILFQHPSELECTKWVGAIKEKLDEFIERPKIVKVFVQPFAGIPKYGRLTYNMKVKPLFDVAEIQEHLTIVNHNEHIKQEITHLDLSEYDCIVIVGGDGTVNKVMSKVMSKTQEVSPVDMASSFCPVKPTVSFGIIPTGVTNHIVHSVQGVEDVVTAAIHIILGTTQPVDLCSVYEGHKFHSWCFNAHYGFFGNVLQHLDRYTVLADKKVNAAFSKALSKSKFRSYVCDLKYLPVNDRKSNHPQDGVVCSQGCKKCVFDDSDCSSHSQYSDDVKPMDNLRDSDENHSLDSKGNVDWQIVSGHFHNVSVLTIPGNMDLCPRGMSKYTHLNDGAIDLALVENIDKKEFLRYLKRHGKNKDQFDFPFIHTYRCKEVVIEPHFKESYKREEEGEEGESEDSKEEETTESKHHDHAKSTKKQTNRSDSIEVIDDLEDNDPVSDTSVRKPNAPRKMFYESNDSAASDNDKDEKTGKEKDSKKKKKKKKEKEIKNKKKDKSSKEKEEKEEDKKQPEKDDDTDQSDSDSKSKKKKGLFHVTPGPSNKKVVDAVDHKERHREYVEKQKRKKEEKARKKEEKRLRSFWNLDNEMSPSASLHFRVHQGLVHIHGAGISPSTDPDDVTMTCFF